MTNKLIDLYREYVRCADMCEAYNKEHRTEIKPRDCVQLKSSTGEWVGYFSLNEPNFSELLEHKLRFAVAILRGRTVFPGGTVYNPEGIEHRVGERHLTVMEGKNKGWNLSFVAITNKWSCEPPKKPRREISDPMRWAEGLIEQLPDTHEGALSWLMYHGDGDKSDYLRKEFNFKKRRAFALNGVELPCPLKSEPCADNLNYSTLCNDGKEFYFSCYEDKQNWRHAFSSLLEQARDKE